MDINSGQPEGSGGGDLDIEASLLRQFSCMGTTDKDELVQQLQKLVGNSLNYNSAVFFLDMNNWNLQAAICSYFDIQTTVRLPEMSLVSDPLANECESIEPSTSFMKNWCVLNSGREAWPADCYLKCSQGDCMGAGNTKIMALPSGEKMFLQVPMRSPSLPGIYQGKWRLCTPCGTYFGDPLWAIITVVEEGTIQLTHQLSHFNALGSSLGNNVTTNPFLQFKNSENVQDDSTLH